MIRGSPADDVIRPKVPASKFVTGFPQLKLLNRLKISTRSSSWRVAAKETSLENATSAVQNPGPSMLLLRWLPYVPGAGAANDAALRYPLVVDDFTDPGAAHIDQRRRPFD